MCVKRLSLVSVLIWTTAATLLAPVSNPAAPVLQASTSVITVALPSQPPPLVRFAGIIQTAEAKTTAIRSISFLMEKIGGLSYPT